jgi:hypothetical protein
MWIVGGLLSAAFAASATWIVGTLGTKNLPGPTGEKSMAFLLVIALLVGFLSGSAICRRVARTREHLALFSGIAGAVAGGAIGCSFAVTLTAAYLANFATWPQDRLDQVLVLLSYPAFGALGLCIGAAGGLLLGGLVGGVLRVATFARQ